MGLFAKETTTLRVAGMTCGNCVRHVTEALEQVKGVKSVRVDLEAGQATVVFKPGTHEADLVAAVRAAGYTAEA